MSPGSEKVLGLKIQLRFERREIGHAVPKLFAKILALLVMLVVAECSSRFRPLLRHCKSPCVLLLQSQTLEPPRSETVQLFMKASEPL